MRKPTQPAVAGTEIETPNDPTQALAEQFAEAREGDQAAAHVPADLDVLQDVQAASLKASELSVKLAKKKAQETEARRREFMKARAEGRPLPPTRTATINQLDDVTLPLDRDGTPAGTPGCVKRWVRMIDAAENPSNNRASMFQKQGYRAVMSRVDGKPITQMKHMLMEATPEADAERRAVAMEGRISAGKAVEDLYHSSIEESNRAAGTTVVKPFAAEGHGEKRRFGVVPPE